jgi:pilus assembly protein CpaF
MEGDVITLQDIFVFETRGMDRVNKIVGEFRPTGIRPVVLEKLSSLGINVAKEIFWPKQEAVR